MKRCTRCREEKPLDDFYLYRNGRPRARCKSCTNEVYREYAAGHPEVIRRAQRTRRSSPHAGRVRGAGRAYAQIVKRDPCSYCGREGGSVDHIEPKGKGGGRDDADNLTGACVACNRRKYQKPLLLFLLEVR